MAEQLTSLEFIIVERIHDWAGWPSPDWLVDTIRRMNWKEADIKRAILSLRDKQIIAFVTHNNETVVRME